MKKNIYEKSTDLILKIASYFSPFNRLFFLAIFFTLLLIIHFFILYNRKQGIFIYMDF